MLNQSRRGNAEDVIVYICFVICIFATAAIFSGIGYNIGESAREQEAIKAGVGEYYTPDPAKKELKFRFKTPDTSNVEH